MLRLCLLIACASTLGSVAWADDRSARAPGSVTTRHLLAGVHAFQDGRFDDALVEFRVVEHAADAPADLAFYLGPTLVKLGRDREAIDVLVDGARDPLSDFYLGEAYYHVKLYRKARALFAALRAHGLGPVLDAGATAYIEAVDVLYRVAPPASTIDYYVDAARESHDDPAFAIELLDEALQVSALTGGDQRHGELAAMLALALNERQRWTATIALLERDPARAPEADWQLARAYAAVHDAAHARPLLDAIARSHGARARDAAALQATLPP